MVFMFYSLILKSSAVDNIHKSLVGFDVIFLSCTVYANMVFYIQEREDIKINSLHHVVDVAWWYKI
jgi:hypothetical protein